MAFPDITYDGDFDHPIEIEGGPLISTDDVTGSIYITRKYAVKNVAYVPSAMGLPDRTFPKSYLVQETPDNIQGPILFFSRLFAQLPVTRTEPRMISFTYLGKSKEDRSKVTGRAIGWNQYGGGAPATRNVQASVAYSYAIDPASFNKPLITKNTFNGVPVDFMGFVYAYKGNDKVSDELTEPFWELIGSTFYALPPAIWIQEVNVTRWRGSIWQMEVVSVNPNPSF